MELSIIRNKYIDIILINMSMTCQCLEITLLKFPDNFKFSMVWGTLVNVVHERLNYDCYLSNFF